MVKLIEQLKFEEGLRLRAYRCTAGKLTIGYGHNLEAKPYFNGERIPSEITEAMANQLLEKDVDDVHDQLATVYHGFLLLQGARRDACVNMAFQLGVQGFMQFKQLLVALDKCEWAKAYTAALDSKWARQTPHRAERVAGQFVDGRHYDVP